MYMVTPRCMYALLLLLLLWCSDERIYKYPYPYSNDASQIDYCRY